MSGPPRVPGVTEVGDKPGSDRPDGVPSVTTLTFCPDCRRMGGLLHRAHLVDPSADGSAWCEGQPQTFVYRYVGPLDPGAA